jgi:hypothetical protein
MLVASWNVLADRFMVGGSHGDYSHVAPELLTYGARQPHVLRVIRDLRDLGVRVFALQEADEQLRDALIAQRYWQVLWSAKPNRTVGQLLLISQDVHITGYQGIPRHMAQRVGIHRLTLVNAHLRWAPADTQNHPGVYQTGHILRGLSDTPAAILTDSNDRPGGPVRALLRQQGFQNVDDERTTAFVNGEPASMDLVAVRGATARMIDTGFRAEGIPTVDCPSDHIPIVADLTW